MPAEEILVDRRGAELCLTINRPQVRNALGSVHLEALRAAFERASADPAVRVVSLTGMGPAFCAGGDLKSIFGSRLPVDIRRFLNLFMRPLIRAMLDCDKPIVAVLNGSVAGAGIGIALSADLIVASERARFVPAFGRIGAMPDSAALYFLAQNLGLLRAKEIVLRNRELTAREAEAMGLYNKVVPPAQLAEAAQSMIDEIAAGPTIAHGLAKRALRDALRVPFDAFMDIESLSMALLITTEDKAEGIKAFQEKRPPQFTGR
jgi:2-(1,2-epoxy-1,2-dihydrophenyl)acetyl-CoA isomerase